MSILNLTRSFGLHHLSPHRREFQEKICEVKQVYKGIKSEGRREVNLATWLREKTDVSRMGRAKYTFQAGMCGPFSPEWGNGP